MFGKAASGLKVERDALNNDKSVAVKSKNTAELELIEKKLAANATAYTAALQRAELAGVLDILPELTPKRRNRIPANIPAPTA